MERKDMEKKKTCQECEKGHNLLWKFREGWDDLKATNENGKMRKIERWGKSKDEKTNESNRKNSTKTE